MLLGQILLPQALGNLAIRHGLANARGIAREHGVKAGRAVGAVELGGNAKAKALEIFRDALALLLVARIDQNGLHRAGRKRRCRAAQHLELSAIDIELDVVWRVELEILDERIERDAKHALLIDRLSLLEPLGVKRARADRVLDGARNQAPIFEHGIAPVLGQRDRHRRNALVALVLQDVAAQRGVGDEARLEGEDASPRGRG